MVANTRMNNLDNCLKVKYNKLQKINNNIADTKNRISYHQTVAKEYALDLKNSEMDPQKLAEKEKHCPGYTEEYLKQRAFYDYNSIIHSNSVMKLKNILNKEEKQAEQLKNDISEIQSTKFDAFDLDDTIGEIIEETFDNEAYQKRKQRETTFESNSNDEY